MTEWQEVGGVGALALALSLVFVPMARRGALHLQMTDRPGAGKAHKVTTPYLGGVAVAVAVLLGAAVNGSWKGQAAAILAAALLVACIGLVDDVRTATPIVRLAVETVAAVIAFSAGARVELLGGPGDLVLTVLWLVVLTNAYNLLDNMDACASLMVATSATALLVAAVLNDQVLVATLAVAVVGGAAGFLVYNWHPARIILGDAGSLFLGFLVSAIALKLRFPAPSGTGLLAVVLVAAPALFDTTLVVISRSLAGRSIYVGGTDHTSHRLVALGLTPHQVALILAAVSAAGGVLGIAVGQGLVEPWAVLAPSAVLGPCLLAVLLRMPIYGDGDGVGVGVGRAVPVAPVRLSR
ncbi:MAG: MraY family glycosyltransferase [Acidimicrobiales bacterium]